MVLIVVLVSGHPMTTAITLIVHITDTKVVAINTVRSSVGTTAAAVLDQVLPVTTIDDLVSRTCYRLR